MKSVGLPAAELLGAQRAELQELQLVQI